MLYINKDVGVNGENVGTNGLISGADIFLQSPLSAEKGVSLHKISCALAI
ncbi:MAG: hypothetical protein K2F98_00335 [Bacteroides sp.]|nr:hypothetical protein [Bacteroides sp.]